VVSYGKLVNTASEGTIYQLTRGERSIGGGGMCMEVNQHKLYTFVLLQWAAATGGN
jgi:hypothetical protein